MALCAASKDGKLEMGYWAIRGLGAPVRMMLEHSGIEYSDFQVNKPDEWFGSKKEEVKKMNPLANLPFLIDGGKCICQTNAIFLYLGDRTGLNGKDADERLMTIQLLEEVYDLRNKIIELVYPFKEVCRDKAEHDTKMTKHLAEGAKDNYAKFEACVKGPFLLGDAISTADFHLFEMLDQHEIMVSDGPVNTPNWTDGVGSLLKDFPKLGALHAAVKAAPTLAKYFASASYALPLNNKIADTYRGDWNSWQAPP